MLDSRVRQTIKIASLLLLLIASVALTSNVRYWHDKSRFLQTLNDQGKELEKAQKELRQTSHMLATAEKKLGFVNKHKTTVQVTAFTGQGTFANGAPTAGAFAVASRHLPEDHVLSIALSPAAQRNLHARMNDYILLLDPDEQKTRLARFVDTTSSNELRPVVDVFFAVEEEARKFGRQHFVAINISTDDSPFTGMGKHE